MYLGKPNTAFVIKMTGYNLQNLNSGGVDSDRSEE
jgi:hypothetical protein